MAKPLNTDLDFNKGQALNMKLHQNSGATKPGSAAGEVWADVTRDQVPVVQRSGGQEDLLFAGQAAPVTLTVGQAPSLGSSVRGMREDARFGLPGVATSGAHGFMPSTDKAKIDASTSAATPLTLAQRDAAGRIQAADPSANSDVVTKQFLESYVSAARPGVARVATTGPIASIAGGAPNVVDGIPLNPGDLVLRKDESTQSQNGVFSVSSVGTGSNGTWVRAAGYDTWTELCAGLLSVEQGTNNAETLWLTTADRTGGVLGTTAVTYVQLPGPMSTIAGAGLIKTGNVFDVNVDGVTLEISSDAIRIKDGGVGTAKIANDAVTYDKLQNIAAAKRVLGSWTTAGANAVELTPAQLRDILGSDLGGALGTVMRAFSIGNGVATSFTINHAFGTRNVLVQVYRATTPWDTIETDVERTDANNVTIRTNTALTSGEYIVVVIGGV